MRAPRSLRTRIALAALAALVIGGAVAIPVTLEAVEDDGRDAVDQELEQRAELVAPDRGPGAPPGFERPGPGPPGGPGEQLLAGSGTFVQVALGDAVVQRRGDVPGDPPPVPDEEGFDTLEIGGGEWRSLTVIRGPRDELRVQLLSSLEPVEERVDSVRRVILLLGLVALAITGLTAWAFTALAVRPLERLRESAARVSDTQDLATTLPDDEGPEEVRSLAHTLNEMLARLRASTEAMERALASTRRFARDAGHELRTPLTGVRAYLDVLERNPGLPEDERQALVREITAEQERIVHLIDGLQALTRGDAAEALPREDVELADLVDGALYAARRRHAGVGFELADLAEGATVHGWAGGLRLLVDNLLDNAALHGAGEGGKVRVDLGREDGTLILRVDDDGPGVPAGERERLLEPFARGREATAPGTGLGLAIVAQQVELHGGELRLADSPLGGLRVEVRLPAGG